MSSDVRMDCVKDMIIKYRIGANTRNGNMDGSSEAACRWYMTGPVSDTRMSRAFGFSLESHLSIYKKLCILVPCEYKLIDGKIITIHHGFNFTDNRPLTKGDFTIYIGNSFKKLNDHGHVERDLMKLLYISINNAICLLMGEDSIPFPLPEFCPVIEVAMEIVKLQYNFSDKLSVEDAVTMYKMYSGVIYDHKFAPDMGYKSRGDVYGECEAFYQRSVLLVDDFLRSKSMWEMWKEIDPEFHQDGIGNLTVWLPTEVVEDTLELVYTRTFYEKRKKNEEELSKLSKLIHYTADFNIPIFDEVHQFMGRRTTYDHIIDMEEVD